MSLLKDVHKGFKMKGSEVALLWFNIGLLWANIVLMHLGGCE